MKKIIGIIFLLTGIFMFKTLDSFTGSDPVDKFAAQISKEIAKKYNLHPCGIGGGATDEGTWLIKFCFQYIGSIINLPEARLLAINISEEFLKKINENEEIKPFLKVVPFTSSNIDLSVICFNYDMTTPLPPALDTISITCGEIGYFTRDPDNQYKYKSKFYEPYEEALAIVKGKKPDKNSKE